MGQRYRKTQKSKRQSKIPAGVKNQKIIEQTDEGKSEKVARTGGRKIGQVKTEQQVWIR